MKQLLQVALVSTLFSGHINPEATVCLRGLPVAEPIRETHLLIITKALHDVTAAEQAVLEAVRRWELFGIKFVVMLDPAGLWTKEDLFWEQFKKDTFAPNSRSAIISIALNEACVIDLFNVLLGYTWVERKIFPNGSKQFTGFVYLCPQFLYTACKKDQDCWATVAQHELGHALGLTHRRGSLMRAGGTPCEQFGFTEHDYFHLYDALLEDRLLHPLLTD